VWVPVRRIASCGSCGGIGCVGVDANADYESANQLQALAMNEGQLWKKKLFSEQG